MTDFDLNDPLSLPLAFKTWLVNYVGQELLLKQLTGYQPRFAETQSLVFKAGSGTPENVVTAPVGSLYVRTNGGAGTTLYVKESGTGNTGWIGK